MGAGASVADIGSASHEELMRAVQAATAEQRKQALVDAPAETKARLAAAIEEADRPRRLTDLFLPLHDVIGTRPQGDVFENVYGCYES